MTSAGHKGLATRSRIKPRQELPRRRPLRRQRIALKPQQAHTAARARIEEHRSQRPDAAQLRLEREQLRNRETEVGARQREFQRWIDGLHQSVQQARREKL